MPEIVSSGKERAIRREKMTLAKIIMASSKNGARIMDERVAEHARPIFSSDWIRYNVIRFHYFSRRGQFLERIWVTFLAHDFCQPTFPMVNFFTFLAVVGSGFREERFFLANHRFYTFLGGIPVLRNCSVHFSRICPRRGLEFIGGRERRGNVFSSPILNASQFVKLWSGVIFMDKYFFNYLFQRME